MSEKSARANLEPRFSPIVELRRYTLHPDRRETLIALFDTHFIESQEACGMKIIGQFRDLDDPNAFVWLRGFDDMQTRHAALSAFYGGPVWAQHRNAANSTMVDSHDVLLLQPADNVGGFALSNARPPKGMTAEPTTVIQAVTYRLKQPAETGFLSFYLTAVRSALEDATDACIAHLATDHSANTFTQLPVRLGENVFVTFSRFDNTGAQATFARHLAQSITWQAVQMALSDYLIAPPAIARLMPTARSLLR